MTARDTIGNNFKTLVPQYANTAAIQDAFKVYHYGTTDPDGVTYAADSIEGHFVQAHVELNVLEDRPVAMITLGTEPSTIPDPTYVSTPQIGDALPDGYIWIDPTGSVDPDTSSLVIADTTTARTTVVSDAHKTVIMTNTGAKTFVIPQNSVAAFAIGTEVQVINAAASGDITVSATSPAVVHYPSFGNLTIEPYETSRIIKVATDAWVIA